MGLKMNINDFKEEEIKRRAYQISKHRKEKGDKYWDDSFGNWMLAKDELQAEDTLRRAREFEENWTRGCCGQ